MTYQYLYQTKDNENRRGEIKAKNRAEAYAGISRIAAHSASPPQTKQPVPAGIVSGSADAARSVIQACRVVPDSDLTITF